MDVAIRFVEALDTDASAAGSDPDLLPERLAHAAAAVLPVDGVGLSLHGEAGRWTSLAASSTVAATAERLQFTAGSGPCLLAAESGLPVFGTEEIPARRWPAFHDLLVTKTPLRSVLALSLAGRFQAVGAMDLYSADPDGVTAVDVYEARCVDQLVSDHLGVAPGVFTPVALILSWFGAVRREVPLTRGDPHRGSDDIPDARVAHRVLPKGRGDGRRPSVAQTR
ncbi:hypothetical protein [Modestobacter marinus]|uniref:hypothetical protein n=1 Tax=Modestobacter marinus TaxID=477641 RepID=UPI001C97C242|nr:hypothetical protein [Modestobacter marinus]